MERPKKRVWQFFLLALVFSLGPGLALGLTVDAKAMVVKELKAKGQYEQLTEEQREKIFLYVPTITKFSTPLMTLFARFCFIGLLSFFGFVLLKTRDPELDWRTVLALVSLASTPLFISDILTTLVYAARDHQTIHLLNPLWSNPAAWFEIDPQEKLLGALIKPFDFFRIWHLILVKKALEVVGKRPTRVSRWLPLVIYIVGISSEVGSAFLRAFMA